MRIISGIYKGKRLYAPKKLPVRPTTDFAKEALFNILTHRIDFDEVSLLDLFSGTGNISYEFGSRGSKEIVSVDGHYECVKFINKTSEELELPITAIKSDVYKYLKASKNSFDVIFADPPYDFDKKKFVELVQIIQDNNLLSPEGFFILEHSKRTKLDDTPGFFESRKYGDSMFSFFS